MPQTPEGLRKAHQTIQERYGNEFYKHVRARRRDYSTAGFASKTVGVDGMTGRQRAKINGSLGGQKSKRVKKGSTPNETENKKPTEKRVIGRTRLF